MKMTFLKITAILAVFASQTNAITIPYGDFDGDTVMYLDVTEDTRDQPAALFGQPAISGDTLDFDPPSFTAQATSSTGTSESEIVDGQLNFTIMSKNGFDLTNVVIRERGDFSLTGLGAAQATASVSSSVFFSVIEVDGMPVNNIDGQGSLVFTPNSGSYMLPMSGGLWNGILDIDVADFLMMNNVTGTATKVEFAIDNTLTAAAADGGSAFISKKDFGAISITVPEPSSALLIFAGLLGLVQQLRRRS